MKNINRSVSFFAVSIWVLSASPVFASTAQVEEQASTDDKNSKTITDRRHPDYVRCRSEPIIGSLSRKRRICMTNEQWVAYTRSGSRDSRQFVEDSQPGFMMTPN